MRGETQIPSEFTFSSFSFFFRASKYRIVSLLSKRERERKTRSMDRRRESCFVNEDRPSNTQIPLESFLILFFYSRDLSLDGARLSGVRAQGDPRSGRVVLIPGCQAARFRSHNHQIRSDAWPAYVGRHDAAGVAQPPLYTQGGFVPRLETNFVALSNAFQRGEGEKGKERSTRHGAPCRERNRLSDLTRVVLYATCTARHPLLFIEFQNRFNYCYEFVYLDRRSPSTVSNRVEYRNEQVSRRLKFFSTKMSVLKKGVRMRSLPVTVVTWSEIRKWAGPFCDDSAPFPTASLPLRTVGKKAPPRGSSSSRTPPRIRSNRPDCCSTLQPLPP